MEDPFENAESIVSAQSEGVEEALEHMKSVLHELRLQDAIYRQKIRKLENQNYELSKSEISSKAGEDEQYLMKQQELIVTLEMAEEIPGERATEVETYKDRLKFKNSSLKRSKELQASLRDVAHKGQYITEDIAELYNNISRVEKIPDNNKPVFVKDLMVKLINSLESLESLELQNVSSLAGDSSIGNSKNASYSKTKGKVGNSKTNKNSEQANDSNGAKVLVFDDGCLKVKYLIQYLWLCILTIFLKG